MPSATSSLKTKAIRAGAGAGKTYNLTHEVVRQALAFKDQQGRWPRFVVTTFTKKATQELSERLTALALKDFPQAIDFVTSSQFLKISTIHGVLDDFLKDQGHWIGLKSDFSYFNQSEALFLSKKILKGLFEKQIEPLQTLMSYFSFSQIHQFLLCSHDRDLHGYEPLSYVESVEMLVQRLSELQKQLHEFLKKCAGCDLPEKWLQTLQRLEVIRQHLTQEKWASPQVALQQIDQLDLKSGLKLKSHPDSHAHYDELKEIVELLRALHHPSMQLRTLQNLSLCNEEYKKLYEIFSREFDEEKMKKSRIEMSDLERFSLKVLRNHPQAATQWGLQKDYWFIDEFQDTSPQQLTLLKALMHQNPYYLVGDPQQSIYLFRGARSEVFAEQFEVVKESGGDVDSLSINYRSTPPIMAFINRVAQELGGHFAEMTPHKKNLSSEADVVVFQATDDEEKTSQESELRFIHQSIQTLQSQGVTLDQIAILVRRNKDLEQVGQYLSKMRIPVHLHSSGLFWKRREIRGALQLLRFLLHAHDTENLVQLLRWPLISITDQQITDYLSRSTDSLWNLIKDDCEKSRLGRSGQILFAARNDLAREGLVCVFEKTLIQLGFFDFHLQMDPTGRSEGNLWKFISLLKKFERERGAFFLQFLNDCERAIENESSVDSPGSVEKNKVNIMTVHASKGLQFEYVILPFLSHKPYREHHLPLAVDERKKRWSVRAPADETETQSSSSLFEKEVLNHFHARQDEEDLRVLYVAMTRAIQKIFLSWSTPFSEKSWAHHFRFLFDKEAGTSFEFGLQVMTNLEEPLVEVTKMTTMNSETPCLPFQERSLKGAPIESHAVTRLIAKNQKNYKAAYIKKQQGILFHKLVEIIKYPVSKDLPSLLHNWFGHNQEDALSALNYILALQQPPVVALMKAGFVEWSFRFVKGSSVIDGQVDLWAILDEVLWIVDYKSGEKVLLESSFSQLEIYAEALQKHLQWQGPINTAVIYPFLQTSFVRTLQTISEAPHT